MIKFEMDLEMIRFRISSIEVDTNQDLPLDQLFKQLDVKRRGFITKKQISDFLIENSNYFASERELKYIMARLDSSYANLLYFD